MSTAFLNPVLFLPNRATLSRSQRHKQGRQSPHPAFQTACRKPTLKSGQRKGKIHTTTYLLPATRQQLIIPYLEVPTLSPPPSPPGLHIPAILPKSLDSTSFFYYYYYYYLLSFWFLLLLLLSSSLSFISDNPPAFPVV